MINTDGVLSTCKGGDHRLCGASFISCRDHVHLFEDQRQRQERRVPLDDRAAHHRRAKGNGAAVLDVRSLHRQRHVFQGVKLQKAVDDTVIAEIDRVPVGALHGLGHDCPAANMTPHPTQDGICENSAGAEHQRSPAPDEEAVLREEVGEVAPGPERGRVISSPLAPTRPFLIATLSRTSVTSTRIKAITALAIGWPPSRSRQVDRIAKIITSAMRSTPILKKSNRKRRVRKSGKLGSYGCHSPSRMTRSQISRAGCRPP